ncbi:MAG: porin, partial [Methylophilaceae bacterium]|nr:porin [Methylophilaceae bacterium]
ELEALRALVQELDQKIRVLDRKGEIAEEKAAADKKAAPVVKAGSSGFSISSADGAHSIKLRGLLQVDHRNYFGDDDPHFNNETALRRVEPRIQGTLFKIFDFDINTEFAKHKEATVLDAYINARFQPWFQIQAGKFKVPLSLERLQGGAALRFAERSYVSDSIAPNRDLGIKVHGKFFDDKINYDIGVFNGIHDGGQSANDDDSTNSKEFAARIFVEPFKGGDSVLAGLGLGLAGTWGDQKGDTEHQSVKYRTPGLNTFFQYAGTTTSDGNKSRLSPQAYYYHGPFGLLTEYIRSSIDIKNATDSTTLDHDAWQIAGSWVLTGEDNGFGVIKPKSKFDWANGGWGAWEVAARYHELEVDKDAFSGGYANAASTTKKAESWSLGLNWYLNDNVKIATSYDHTSFDSGIDGVDDREDEKALFSRLQVAF